jgi:hypothetical protein
MAGVVSLAGRWWNVPEDQGPIANILGPSAWTPGGQPAFNDVFVEVVRAGPGVHDQAASAAKAITAA